MKVKYLSVISKLVLAFIVQLYAFGLVFFDFKVGIELLLTTLGFIVCACFVCCCYEGNLGREAARFWVPGACLAGSIAVANMARIYFNQQDVPIVGVALDGVAIASFLLIAIETEFWRPYRSSSPNMPPEPTR